MPRISKFTVSMILSTLVLVGFLLLTGFKSGWMLIFLPLMPLLWTLWLACVVFDKNRNLWQLALPWMLIDICVLGIATLFFGNEYGGGHNDSEYFCVIAFSPLFLPILGFAILPVFGNGLSAIALGASDLLLSGSHASVLSDWLEFSVLSAIVSYLFVSLFQYWKWYKERNRERVKMATVTSNDR